jgi:hypothetical protein
MLYKKSYILLFDEFDEFHDKRRNDDGVDITE